MKAKQKLNNRKGFTLTEMLAAMLILLMVSSIVAAGIPVAKNAYDKAVDAANAHVLLSTAVNALRNELDKADEIEISAEAGADGKVLTFYSERTNAKSKIYLDATSKEIMLQEYVGFEDYTDGVSVPERRLVTRQASTSDLYVTYESVAYANGLVTVTGLAVKNASRTVTTLDSLVIRVITAA